MFQDTQPAQLGSTASVDAWAEFRVDHPRERLALLRQLRDHNVAVNLSSPEGLMLSTTLWALDDLRGSLSFSADDGQPQLERLVEFNEAVAVAYLDSVKLQFDLVELLLVRGARSTALQAQMPSEIYRFQRRNAYRVRTLELHSPQARLRHPAIPEMALALRVLDVSAGGCALFLPHDVPPLPAGCRFSAVQIELDADTRFATSLTLQHVTAIQPNGRGVRLGCEWTPLDGLSARALQRYIDLTQRRRRLLASR
ncbi:MAG: flagellar brake protein [Burkholderiales bacterium]|nr:flagellar brake protein [Burkholderiales bacterium]MDE2453858.1 flagellar brake protein [Burkholderiales bacterium]